MFDETGFLHYFANTVKAAANTCATYKYFLKRIDEAVGGLDEKLTAEGLEATMEWARTTQAEPFATYRAHARSVLKRYAMYRIEELSGEDAGVDDALVPAAETPGGLLEADANFIREKEMQVQVRQQLTGLEPGLHAIDDGKEVQVPNGRIDILACDASGRVVVIELKAGKCPTGALEQLLAYTYDIEQDRKESPRALLVAGAFSDRQRAAARRSGVELKTYAYSLSFQADD